MAVWPRASADKSHKLSSLPTAEDRGLLLWLLTWKTFSHEVKRAAGKTRYCSNLSQSISRWLGKVAYSAALQVAACAPDYTVLWCESWIFCPIVGLWFLQDEGSWLQNGTYFSPFFFPSFFLATHFSFIWCYTSLASFNLLFLTIQLLLHFCSAEKRQYGRVISLVQLLQPFNPLKG